MKKIIREVDEKKGIVQVTIADERWYIKSITNPTTGIDEYKFVPSVTWISGCYPKGIQFYKWLAEKGWDEAEAIKTAAGDKGTKVHKAIESVLKGEEVRIDSKFINPTSQNAEELTLEECDAVLSFIAWKNAVKPEFIAWEVVVWSDQHDFAGSIDLICKIGEEFWVIDFKTSQSVWKSQEIQVSAYKEIVENGENVFNGLDPAKLKAGILQVGYRKNKAGYKFTELDNKFALFKTAQDIWREEHGGEAPTKKDYPIILSPALTIADVIEPEKTKVKK